MWAIGAQNAGKSTLINSIGEHVGGGGGKITHLTEVPVPGTTLEWRGFCQGRGSCLTHGAFASSSDHHKVDEGRSKASAY